MKKLLLIVTHLGFAAVGFAAGIYMLPILTAPPSPSATELEQVSDAAMFEARFERDLAGSDFLHWGEGTVLLNNKAIALRGELAPGPDYQLYLSPVMVHDEAEFEATRSGMVRVGAVNTFKDFLVPLDAEISLNDYRAVVVWCESFGEFITAGTYRD